MFTTIDKAIVALVMSLAFLFETFIGETLGIDDETLTMFLAAATPVLVWAWPNKPWSGFSARSGG